MVLAVSVETIDNGRGIYSRVSEKPTFARAGFIVGLVSALLLSNSGVWLVSFSSSATCSTAVSFAGCSAGSPKDMFLFPKSAGLVGALLPRDGFGLLGGLRIIERS